MRRVIEQISSIACKSTFAPNKQTIEHNNLATTWGAKLKGTYTIHEPPIFKNLNSKCNSNKNKEASHWGLLPYDNNKWKYELNEINTSLFKFSSKPQGPLLYIYVYF